jgi:hypothetical protein
VKQVGKFLFVILCLAAISCRPAVDRPFTTRRDSSGVSIFESMQPVWNPGEEWKVDSVPFVDLGASGAGPEYEFFRIRNASRLPDGRIAVANYGTNEVRLYDPNGKFLWALGRSGEGPGEFQRLTSVRPYRGDTLLAFDYWARRITLVAPSGGVGRVTTLLGLNGSLNDLYPFSDGRFLLLTSAITAMANAQGRMRVPAPLLLLGADGVVVDTIAVVLGFETYVFDQGDARPPLPHQVYVAVRDSLTYVAEGETFEFRVFSADGTLGQIVRLPEYDLRVPEAVRDSLKAAMLDQELPPQLRPTMEAMANSIPTRRPAYSGLAVDPSGCVWVQEFTLNVADSQQPRRWLVFDPSGSWMGAVELPANFDLFQVGEDYVLGRFRDEMDVETIRLLRLLRS